MILFFINIIEFNIPRIALASRQICLSLRIRDAYFIVGSAINYDLAQQHIVAINAKRIELLHPIFLLKSESNIMDVRSVKEVASFLSGKREGSKAEQN